MHIIVHIIQCKYVHTLHVCVHMLCFGCANASLVYATSGAAVLEFSAYCVCVCVSVCVGGLVGGWVSGYVGGCGHYSPPTRPPLLQVLQWWTEQENRAVPQGE